jgi:putative spermidine/putrescine transport system permease protein
MADFSTGVRFRRRVDAVTWRLASFTTLMLAAMLLLVPTLIALAASFNGGESLRFPPRDLSWRWYQALWNESDDIWAAFAISLRVSFLATLGAGLMATLAALHLARQRTAWARALETFFQSPMMLPGISLGLAMLVWLQTIGVPLSYWSLVIGHMAISTPYIIRTALIGFGQIDPSVLEASRSLGANGLRTFTRITLPLALPAVLAGGFIAFMFSFDNVPISLFLSDARSEVLPIRLWNLIENLLDVRAAAVAGALIVFTLIFALVMERVLGVSRYVR